MKKIQRNGNNIKHKKVHLLRNQIMFLYVVNLTLVFEVRSWLEEES